MELKPEMQRGEQQHVSEVGKGETHMAYMSIIDASDCVFCSARGGRGGVGFRPGFLSSSFT